MQFLVMVTDNSNISGYLKIFLSVQGNVCSRRRVYEGNVRVIDLTLI